LRINHFKERKRERMSMKSNKSSGRSRQMRNFGNVKSPARRFHGKEAVYPKGCAQTYMMQYHSIAAARTAFLHRRAGRGI